MHYDGSVINSVYWTFFNYYAQLGVSSDDNCG